MRMKRGRKDKEDERKARQQGRDKRAGHGWDEAAAGGRSAAGRERPSAAVASPRSLRQIFP